MVSACSTVRHGGSALVEVHFLPLSSLTKDLEIAIPIPKIFLVQWTTEWGVLVAVVLLLGADAGLVETIRALPRNRSLQRSVLRSSR